MTLADAGLQVFPDNGGTYHVKTSLGVNMRFDNDGNIYIVAAREHRNALVGLCGNYNAQPQG